MKGLALGFAIFLIALLASPPLAPAAQAADDTYDVFSCAGPGGEPLPATAWQREGFEPASGAIVAAPAGVHFANACSHEGALSVAIEGGELLSGSAGGALSFRAPAGTRIVAYELRRSLAVEGSSLLASYRAELLAAGEGGASSSEDCTAPGCPAGGLGTVSWPDPEASGAALETLALRASVSCSLLSVCLSLPSGEAVRATLYGSRVTLEDSEAPTARVAGAPADGAAVDALETLRISASDVGSGVESIAVRLDGRPVREANSGQLAESCRLPYTRARPCPRQAQRSFALEAAALAPGEHQLSVTVADAAGNVTEWGPVGFAVEARRTPPPPAPAAAVRAGAATATTMARGAAPRKRARLRLAAGMVIRPRGSWARLAGTLTTLGGKPIAGAGLTLEARQLGLAGNAGPRRRGTVRTNRLGRFVVKLRAVGARQLIVTYRPRRGARAVARARGVVRSELALRAAPSRRLLVRGRRLTLRGQLGGAGPSARGALVQIEAIVNGRWTPVGSARVRANGSFAWRYRFVRLARDTIFSFRAAVIRVPGWPWPSIHSHRVQVRVNVR